MRPVLLLALAACAAPDPVDEGPEPPPPLEDGDWTWRSRLRWEEPESGPVRGDVELSGPDYVMKQSDTIWAVTVHDGGTHVELDELIDGGTWAEAVLGEPVGARLHYDLVPEGLPSPSDEPTGDRFEVWVADGGGLRAELTYVDSGGFVSSSRRGRLHRDGD